MSYPCDPLVRVPLLKPGGAPIFGPCKRPRRDVRDLARARKVAAREDRRDDAK